MFHCFLSDDSKQYAAATTAQSKRLSDLLKKQKVLTSTLGKIWENTDGYAEYYRCALTLYMMSVMSQYYSVIIYRVISEHGNSKEVVDGINVIVKRYIHQLISNVQLLGSIFFNSQILMNSCTQNNDVSLAK